MGNVWQQMRSVVKEVVKLIPIAFTRNQKYDRDTAAIIRKHCHANSNCIDVGTHRGEILDIMRQAAPEGTHFGFEPLPYLFGALQQKYAGLHGIHVFPFALAEAPGTASFNHVKTNPAYSGLQKRSYDRPGEEDETIVVEKQTLDAVLREFDMPIALIKIDVEGGEMGVLRGATNMLRKYHPVIIFEFGVGGSDIYGTTPRMLFDFFKDHGYEVSLMERYLKGAPALSVEELNAQFYGKKNFYFIAY